MFGLEKKEKKEKFQFDLEEEIAQDPKRANKIMKTAQDQIEELKKLLRSGLSEEEFEEYGILLHGYSTLNRVIKRITKR